MTLSIQEVKQYKEKPNLLRVQLNTPELTNNKVVRDNETIIKGWTTINIHPEGQECIISKAKQHFCSSVAAWGATLDSGATKEVITEIRNHERKWERTLFNTITRLYLLSEGSGPPTFSTKDDTTPIGWNFQDTYSHGHTDKNAAST